MLGTGFRRPRVVRNTILQGASVRNEIFLILQAASVRNNTAVFFSVGFHNNYVYERVTRTATRFATPGLDQTPTQDTVESLQNAVARPDRGSRWPTPSL